MKNHLKRIPAPKTWSLNRKKNTFVVRPSPGAHPIEYSLPLGIVLRDILKHGQTIKEVKKILNNKTVLVDGQRKKDHHLGVGLFDVLSFPDIKEYWRVLFNSKGRTILKKINVEESKIKPCKIVNKTKLSKNIQLNLHDGKNILVDDKFKGKVGDTVLISLPDQKIQETLELTKDAFVYIFRGRRSGDSGVLQEIKENQATYQKDKKNIETLKKYLFVLGTKKPSIGIE